jgi:zinc protease
MPSAPAVSVWVGYKVGSRNERPGITGATHWVEHMLFKGGGNLRKGDIDSIVGRLGGKFNGFTDTDFTIYFETLPPEHLETGLMIEAERMRNAAFDPRETEAERGVIISEREGAENSPKYLLSEEMWHLAFHVHPYHWPVLGWKTDLERMQRDELYAYYLRHYAPNNAVLVLAGRFDERDAMDKVRAYFGGFRPEAQPPPLAVKEPTQDGERRSVIRRPGTQDHVMIGYRVPGLAHPDTAALLVLQAILGGWRGLSPFGGQFVSRSNRLYRGLVDRKLATDVSAQHRMSADPGLLTVEATVREGVDAAKVEAAAINEVESLRARPPTKAEMTRALRQVRVWHAYDLDGPTAQALLYTWFETVASHGMLDDLIARCQGVTARDVRRVAGAHLGEGNRTVCTFLAREETT